MRDWHAAGVKREATIARLDVLEAAVLALSERCRRPSGFLLRITWPTPVAPVAEASAAPTLAAVLAALSR